MSAYLASRYIPLTKVDAEIPQGHAYGLLVGTAGTANLMQPDGTIQNGVPLPASPVPIVVRRLLPGGTADNIWGLFP